MSSLPSPSEEEDLLAAELAFGLLDLHDKADANARLASDAEFAARFSVWNDRLMELADGFDEAPRPSSWATLMARLPANENRRAPRDAIASSRFWRAATAASTAVAIVLAVAAFERSTTPPLVPQSTPTASSPPLVAVLTASGSSVVTVSYDRANGRLVSAPARLDLAVARSAQLWVIPSDGTPRSLGLITATAPSAIRPPDATAKWITSGATLAISVEPPGGSPTGRPTGRVILTGKINQT